MTAKLKRNLTKVKDLSLIHIYAWCVTYKFDKQTILPGSRLPEDGIVPFLLEAKPKKQIPIQLASIPGKYYQA